MLLPNTSVQGCNDDGEQFVAQTPTPQTTTIATDNSTAKPPPAQPPPLPPRTPPANLALKPMQFSLCKHFEKRGKCRLGVNCKFAHGEDELEHWNSLEGATRPAPPVTVSIFPIRDPPDTTGLLRKPDCFVLCRHYVRGLCRVGEACRFAHGVEELNAWNRACGLPEVTHEQVQEQVRINLEHDAQHPVVRETNDNLLPEERRSTQRNPTREISAAHYNDIWSQPILTPAAMPVQPALPPHSQPPPLPPRAATHHHFPSYDVPLASPTFFFYPSTHRSLPSLMYHPPPHQYPQPHSLPHSFAQLSLHQHYQHQPPQFVAGPRQLHARVPFVRPPPQPTQRQAQLFRSQSDPHTISTPATTSTTNRSASPTLTSRTTSSS